MARAFCNVMRSRGSHLILVVVALSVVGWVLAEFWPRRSAASATDALASGTGTRVTCETSVPQFGSAPALGMVWIPAGRYTPGDTVYPEEYPAGAVEVDGFWMDRTEVTNDQFAEFVQATGYVTVAERPVDPSRRPHGTPANLLQPGAAVFKIPPIAQTGADPSTWWRFVPDANWRHPGGPETSIDGRGAFPVVEVTEQDAKAYARWKGRRLPSEAQWEWAARGARDEPMPAHEQPIQANTWQGRFPLHDTGQDGFVGLAPVGCYPPNRLGLYDMIGNVWEITADVFAHHGATVAALASQRAPRQFVVKGGSYLCSPDYCMRYRVGSRQPMEEDLGASHTGFRTVLLAPGPPG
jgi:formylglycine-generating enzyme required for sulfatase activity